MNGNSVPAKAGIKKHDLIIIGAGPAGLTASIYASRYKINHLVLEGEEISQTAEAHLVENYPGFISIKGTDLIETFKKHAKQFGTDLILDAVKGAKKINKDFQLTTKQGKVFQTKSIIFAIGVQRRKLNVPGEEKFFGKGISYCAVCDAPFFKNKTVAVVGGANSAAMAAVHLTGFADKVYQIYRKDKLRSEPVWTDRVLDSKKIEVIYNTNIEEVKGSNSVEKIILDKAYKGKNELDVDGLFVEVGAVPYDALAKQLDVDLDGDRYIKINPDCSTSAKGVYAAGDITDGSNKLKQITTATSEGTIAATSVFKYLSRH